VQVSTLGAAFLGSPSFRVSGPSNVDLVIAYRAARSSENAKECQRLRSAVVEKNRGLVRKAIGRYMRPKTEADEDDCMQAGCMGVLRALEDFDPGRGTSFSTYAMHWIRDHMQRWAGKPATVNRPRSASMPAKLAQAATVFRVQHGREPTAAELGVTEGQLTEWSEGTLFVYLDENTDEKDERRGLLELADDPKQAEHTVERMQLETAWNEAVGQLSERNAKIAEAVLWEGRGPVEVAEEHGITHGFVVQICQRVEADIKKSIARAKAPPSSKRTHTESRTYGGPRR
jgi:RNA polymerase sigma factor (sigma-70 family)